MPASTLVLPERTWIEIDGVVYGARPDGNGPIGGGAGYTRTVSGGNHVATTVPELVAALAKAKAGEVVFVPGTVEMDFTEWVYTDELMLRVPAGVTLASDRGHRGSPGALLFSEAQQTRLIEVEGPDVRITGLRLRGPDPKRRLIFHHRIFFEGEGTDQSRNQKYYKLPTSGAIRSKGTGLEVDNCEISGWSHTGVYAMAGSVHLHHCFIHHCQRMGLGYGMTLDKAEALVEYCVLQDNKHHLAGTGAPGTAYEIRHNVVLPPTEPHVHPITGGAYGQDWTFDMHGGEDRLDGTDIAGRYMRVSNNLVLPEYPAVVIRGQPQERAEIHHNWFYRHRPGKTTVQGRGEVIVGENAYGPEGKIDR